MFSPFAASAGVQAFGQACLSQPGCPLQRLDLSDCEAGDAAAVALASALMEGRQAEAGGIPQGGHQSGPEALMGAGGMPPSPSNQNPKGSRTGPLTDLNLSANQFTIKGVGCGVWRVMINGLGMPLPQCQKQKTLIS